MGRLSFKKIFIWEELIFFQEDLIFFQDDLIFFQENLIFFQENLIFFQENLIFFQEDFLLNKRIYFREDFFKENFRLGIFSFKKIFSREDLSMLFWLLLLGRLVVLMLKICQWQKWFDLRKFFTIVHISQKCARSVSWELSI